MTQTPLLNSDANAQVCESIIIIFVTPVHST